MGWGLMTMLLSTIHNFAGLVVVRFLLGAFEAGVFPGMVYISTFWYKQDERALRIALISACATLGMPAFSRELSPPDIFLQVAPSEVQ